MLSDEDEEVKEEGESLESKSSFREDGQSPMISLELKEAIRVLVDNVCSCLKFKATPTFWTYGHQYRISFYIQEIY